MYRARFACPFKATRWSWNYPQGLSENNSMILLSNKLLFFGKEDKSTSTSFQSKSYMNNSLLFYVELFF